MNSMRSITFCVLVTLLCFAVLSGCATVGDPSAEGALTQGPTGERAAGSEIRGLVFERLEGKERISIDLSGLADCHISRESERTLLITLEGVSIPEGVQREYGRAGLRNLERVLLYQDRAGAKNETGVRVVLKRLVPYRYRTEGTTVMVDFDVSVLPPAAKPDRSAIVATAPAEAGAASPQAPALQEPDQKKMRAYTGETVSLDFQDADIKSVFRLLSEVSGLSIVAGPNVKGDVTVHMKNVPWDQALDTVLEINGLGKKQAGRVITVLPVAVLKQVEEEQQEKAVTQGKLKQVSIEAKIVEVTTNFARELGIKWGYGYTGNWGERDYGVMIGTGASGALTSLPNGIGLTSSNVAVNFPSLTSVTTPALGLVVGTSKFILDAQLSALEKSGDGKIISSPKVTTLDGVKATIKQGEEIPYTVTSDEGKQSTEFKEATLKLEVTPTITPEGRISIEMRASNDYADWEIDPQTGLRVDEPPINTSSVESTVVVRDGETIVIGGVYKTTASESISGVPWLSKIPVLGWLFKYKTVSNEKRELLIFVTPKVVAES